MRLRILLAGALLLLGLASPAWTFASTGDLGAIIEGFVHRHFPDAAHHMWVVNGTQWDGDEMVVDLYTYVVEKQQTATLENRYLLLIVEGKLTAAQRIPFDDGPGCQPEDA